MIEEIININGQQYRLSADTPLTVEQRQQTITEIEKQLNCSTCGSQNLSIKSLAKTCTATVKTTGQTITLAATSSGGTGTKTTVYWKRDNPLAAKTTITSPYTVLSADRGNKNFGTTVTDTCSPPQSVEEYCTISLNPDYLATILIPSISSVLVGASVTLGATCRNQYDEAMTCPSLTWTSDNIAIASINPTSGLLTGTGPGNVTIRATSGTVVGTVLVTVTCATLGVSLTVT